MGSGAGSKAINRARIGAKGICERELGQMQGRHQSTVSMHLLGHLGEAWGVATVKIHCWECF